MGNRNILLKRYRNLHAGNGVAIKYLTTVCPKCQAVSATKRIDGGLLSGSSLSRTPPSRKVNSADGNLGSLCVAPIIRKEKARLDR